LELLAAPAQVAQLVEHFHGKEGVTSSSLVLGLTWRFDQMEQRFERIEAELRMWGTEINEGFRSLHRMTLQIGAGMFGTLLLAILTMLSTHG
jgi:hypothetical protein